MATLTPAHLLTLAVNALLRLTAPAPCAAAGRRTFVQGKNFGEK